MSAPENKKDLSNGWESRAHVFIANRNLAMGISIAENWASSFAAGQEILDVGCGFGGPYTQSLLDRGLQVYGVDASNTLLQEHRKRFPAVPTRCEAAETSNFFNKKFQGILSVGLIFLLPTKDQLTLLENMASALNQNGKLMFTAPWQVCSWNDLLTGRKSASLGRDRYRSTLANHGLALVNEYTDEGENHYYSFEKNND